MKKLFLTSAGLSNETRQYFLELLTTPIQKTTVAFIPTAANVEKDISFVKKAKNELLEIGFNVIDIDISNENEQSLRKKISHVDIIYVNGGNTFYLLQMVYTSGFAKIIKEKIEKGVIYVGSSAGSYIACPTIEMATWPHQDRDRFELEDFTGLNLVPFLISAHYKQDYMAIIKEEAKKTLLPIVALNDTQAITCINNHYKIVGLGDKITFNGFKEN